VELVAASSAIPATAAVDGGLAVLRSWGLRPRGRSRLQRRWGLLAGSDHERGRDLAEPEAAALRLCARGGWGSARLLERHLPWRGGWLLGFSDVTSLLWARQAAGIAGGLHGPLLTTLAAEPPWSRERLRRLLFGEPPAALPDLTGESWCGGEASGPLLVANLTVATHLLGTPHLPPLKGRILVLEDVGERPYRLDRLLTHWRLCGALQQLAGIGFGRFSDCGDPPEPARDPEPAGAGGGPRDAAAVLRERTHDLGIPVLAGLPVGHDPGNAVLPIGAPARLDGTRGRLTLLG
jgi:muramoyltetrapeptide carboxypeptidase